MRRIFLSFLISGGLLMQAFPQAQIRRFPSIINHPSLDLSAPYVSLDGNALLFISNSGQDGALIVSYTSRESDWNTPTELPKHLNTRLNFLKGYSLSADGRKMYFTCAKSPVIGGYDIFVSELKGTTWTQPENLALPINSKLNDGCASFTADGSTIFFMRCDKMDQSKAESCKIFSAKKKSNGQWEEPVELPANINTGNSQAPRIMADGETLVFSSNKFPGNKGGMDLYISKLKSGTWTEPVALDFVNTDKDDEFVSVTALGRYLVKESLGARKNMEVTEFLIPNNLRPKGMMKVEGKVADPSGAAVPAYVSATDLSTNKRFYSGRPSTDGSYFFYLAEGTRYDVSIDPEQSNFTYVSKVFDLTTDKTPQKEKLNATLKAPQPGDEISLDAVQFKSNSSELDNTSTTVLKKLQRLASGNPNLKFEIQVLMTGYLEDSVKSSPDLTELTIDSVHTLVDEIDDQGQLYKKDSVLVKRLYHNDRTNQQAQVIIAYLVSQGANANSFSYLGNAIAAATPENRRLTIKAVVRGK